MSLLSIGETSGEAPSRRLADDKNRGLYPPISRFFAETVDIPLYKLRRTLS